MRLTPFPQPEANSPSCFPTFCFSSVLQSKNSCGEVHSATGVFGKDSLNQAPTTWLVLSPFLGGVDSPVVTVKCLARPRF